jgi:autotransporter-associated beta strand protein
MSLSARTFNRPVFLCAFAVAFAVFGGQICTKELYAGDRNDVGYKALVNQLGTAAPNGAGVPVLMAEFGIDGGYPAMATLPQFANKSIAVRTPIGGNSLHATDVAESFFGLTTSLAPGVTQVEVYETNDFLTHGFMHWATSALPPNVSLQASRVANHSWIASAANANMTIEHLGRLDWLVHQDDFVQVVGVNNGPIGNSPLYSNSLNSIAVGVTHGNHPTGTLEIGGVYSAGRTKPDLVVPAYVTSFAAPVVSGASAVLIQTGHANPSLSNGSYTLARLPAQRIYHAETSEVIKAALLSGADRLVFNSDGTTILDYRDASFLTANGMDTRFGAGQLNVYNSYGIIAGGEQNALQDGGATSIGPAGFDYDPKFGGANGSNNTATYDFTAGWTGQTLAASLVWNARVNIDQLRTSPYNKASAVTLHDLNLTLLDITSPTNPVLVALSSGALQNTENIHVSLQAGRRYRMQVTAAGAPFEWDYGLAWTTTGTLGWSGASGGVWKDKDPSQRNWLRGANLGGFVSGEHVVFSDSGFDKSVDIAGDVAPASVVVDNSIQHTYSFNGGSIVGATGLIKRGGGLLGLANQNNYAGMTVIENGGISLNRSNSISTQSDLTIQSTGTLYLNGFNQLVKSISGEGVVSLGGGTLTIGSGNGGGQFSGGFVGNGEIVKTGLGWHEQNSGHPFGGRITVQDGHLVVAADYALGTSAGETVVGPAGSLFLKGPFNYTSAERIVLNGNGSSPGYGSLENNEGDNSLAAHITLGSDSLIGVTGGKLALTGKLSIPSQMRLTKHGASELAIHGSMEFGDSTAFSVYAGTLKLSPAATSTVALSASPPVLQIAFDGLVRVNASARNPLADTFDPSRRVEVENLGGPGLVVDAGHVEVGSVYGGGQTYVNPFSVLSATNIRQYSLFLGGVASGAIIRPNGSSSGTSTLVVLRMDPGSVFDLTDNDLVVRANHLTKNTVHSTIQASILGAHNGVDANFVTNWNGAGITSSMARFVNVRYGFDLFGLGVIRNSDLEVVTGTPNHYYSAFSGQLVGQHDVLVKYTYVGDTNLDGIVSFDDYAAMDAAFFGVVPNLGWATGDINLDGLINFDDYAAVDRVFFHNGGPLGGESFSANDSFANSRFEPLAVPEPSAIVLAFLSLLGIAAWTTRQKLRLR